MQKSGINQTQGIMLSHCLHSDRLPKKTAKNHDVASVNIYHSAFL